MFQGLWRFSAVKLLVVTLIVLSPILAVGGGAITIVGEVNDNFQIVTDNDQYYEIELNDAGEELIDHVGERVKVIGEVVEEGENHLITVSSFEVLEQEEDNESTDEKTKNE